MHVKILHGFTECLSQQYNFHRVINSYIEGFIRDTVNSKSEHDTQIEYVNSILDVV